MICPQVISPATRKEFKTNFTSGTYFNAWLKFSQVGALGSKLNSVVKSSLDGINATLTAYRSGSKMISATIVFKLTNRIFWFRFFARAF